MKGAIAAGFALKLLQLITGISDPTALEPESSAFTSGNSLSEPAPLSMGL